MTVDGKSLTGELGASRLAVLDALRRLPEDAWAPGQWVARGVVAHLAAWDEISTVFLNAAAAGAPTPPLVPDDDAFNAQAVAEAESLSAVQVVLRFHAARAALVAAVSGLDADMSVAVPWGGHGTVREVVLGLVSHERYHVGELATGGES
ncbi:MAG: DinB family protein [Anaerolineae bacterium]